MTREQIKAALDRVLTWPAEAQEEALATLEEIEKEISGSISLSADDREALERSGEDARHGRFASDHEVSEVFARHQRG